MYVPRLTALALVLLLPAALASNSTNGTDATTNDGQQPQGSSTTTTSPPHPAGPFGGIVIPPKAICTLDASIVNAETLPLLEDIGVSIFASACSKNRGAFVLDPPDGHTYGCLNLPQQLLLESIQVNASDSLFNMTKVEDIKNNFANGNLTAGDAVVLLDFLVKHAYSSTPGVEVSPFACDISGLVTLESCPAKDQRRRQLYALQTAEEEPVKDPDQDDDSVGGEPQKETTADGKIKMPLAKKGAQVTPDGRSVPIRATTIAGVFSPLATWAVDNTSTPIGDTLTQRDAEFFYVPTDFNKMSKMGLNAVQFPVAVELFAELPRVLTGWLNLLTKWIEYAARYKMQIIVKLEYTPKSQGDTSLMGAIEQAMIFCNGINIHLNKTAILAVTLPSADPAVIGAAANAQTAIPLWLPAQLQDLTHIQELAAAVPGAPIQAISLDLSHTATVADIASSTAEEDRNKLVFHETMACLQRAPLEYTECYQGLPVFVSSGFDLAIDDCHLQRVAGAAFKDYGQCDRLDETLHSHWWHEHRLSFAARQIAAYEKGGLGWSYSTWKVFRVGKEKMGLIDKPAKLLALQDVHANGWIPSLTEDQDELALACLNPPLQDATLGDETLAPTFGPPPDCGEGWWNATTEQCDFWIPPPFNASECPNTTIIYEECNATVGIDVDEGAAEEGSSGHPVLKGFVGGLVVASVVFAIMYCVGSGSKQYQYQAIPETASGFQEYQHHSRTSVDEAILSSQPPNSLRTQGRTRV